MPRRNPTVVRDADNKIIRVDTNLDPTRRTMVRRLANLYDAAPDEVKAAGEEWYPNLNRMAIRASKATGGRRSVAHASGAIVSVSPNMDWERDNIAALDELESLTGRQWKAIMESARAQGNRTPDVTEMLQGMAISKAPDANLVKAHRIWVKGEHPEVVLPRSTAPKTNSMMRNGADPLNSEEVTIDGRSSDQVVDAMRPWKQSRGIDSAALRSGAPTRYERYETAHRAAAKALNVKMPSTVQAVDWEVGRILERKNNPDRVQGDARVGQSYQGRAAEFLGATGLT